MIAAVSLTVFVAQQQQQLKQHAAYICPTDPKDIPPDECNSPAALEKKNKCDIYPDYKCKNIHDDKSYDVEGCQ